MILSDLKKALSSLDSLVFKLPNGNLVPLHFHVTEVGMISKSFIDCGGTLRQEKKVNFQLWEAGDYDHRLGAKKLLNIIDLSIEKLNLPDSEIEVEYQGDTIQKFGVELNGSELQLTALHTDCLAKDNCGIPSGQQGKQEKQKVQLVDFGQNLDNEASCCTPGGGCC